MCIRDRVPVIASRPGALAEAVRDGIDGLLVTPGDVAAWAATLQRCVDEPAQLARWAANVRPPLTLAQHVEAIEAQYRQALAKTRP
jgi:glycosyltransferase involved in cell wall biosynthesis